MSQRKQSPCGGCSGLDSQPGAYSAEAVLMAKREEIRGRRRDLIVQTSPEVMEQTVMQALRETEELSADRDARTLADVTAALNRLRAGTYGQCLTCDEQIAAKRLMAVPEAARCRGCQEIAERPQVDVHV
jgi:DnaK suppressor protein